MIRRAPRSPRKFEAAERPPRHLPPQLPRPRQPGLGRVRVPQEVAGPRSRFPWALLRCDRGRDPPAAGAADPPARALPLQRAISTLRFRPMSSTESSVRSHEQAGDILVVDDNLANLVAIEAALGPL